MKPNVVLTVGNGLMGDDAAGVLLAQLLHETPLPGWQLVHGGAMPENVLHQVRDLAPQRVLVVDAADMDLPPGSLRRLDGARLEDPFLISTHTLPLSYLIQALGEFTPCVELLGIQPGVVAFGYPASPPVIDAVRAVYQALQSGETDWELLQP